MAHSSFFPTGKNCKIKINGVTMAYATGLLYAVTVPHRASKTLGVYEVNSLEPVSYEVEGSFTIIRYAEGAVKALIEKGLSPPGGASNDGNGVGSWTVNRSGTAYNKSGASVVNSFIGDGGAHTSTNPNELQSAITFDIEIYQKIQDDIYGLSRIRNCRITRMESRISTKEIMTQTFSFMAQYVDEDSFIADSSGVGQLIT